MSGGSEDGGRNLDYDNPEDEEYKVRVSKD